MHFTVTIDHPSAANQQTPSTAAKKTFQVASTQTILEAAAQQGVILPYACKNGGCGTCKAKVTQGEFTTTSQYLTTAQHNEGQALLCCSYAQSDLTIACEVIEGVANIPVKKMPTRVRSIEYLSANIIRLILQLPTNQSFVFLSGQYVDFLLKDGQRRSYSIANLTNEGHLELHIRHLPGGLFTDALFTQNIPDTQNAEDAKNAVASITEAKAANAAALNPIKEKDILRIEGPLGIFFLRDNARPIIFIASGTGFAPIQSIILSMQQQNIQRSIHLYWGGRVAEDIYAADLCQTWQATFTAFKFIPVLSEASQTVTDWQGRTGLVHQAVLDDFTDLSNYEVYACGAPIMVEAAQRDFIALRNLPEMHFFADAFTNVHASTGTGAGALIKN